MAFAARLLRQSSSSLPSIYHAARCMSSRIFVGGLSYGVDDHTLKDSFSTFGEVIDARIINDRETGKPRGFGFVSFTCPDDANAAIQAMDGKELHGRTITVNLAQERTFELMQQETWDNIVVDFFEKSVAVIRTLNWTLSLGDALCRQYELYIGDNEHSGLLHRCLGMLLQKVDDRAYVSEKLDLMYSKANMADRANRIALAKGMGLVAVTHIDTVLEKVKNMIENEAPNKFQRFIKYLFMDRGSKEDVDNRHAAVALIYSYIASYAPSSQIEGRINALGNINAFEVPSCANSISKAGSHDCN